MRTSVRLLLAGAAALAACQDSADPISPQPDDAFVAADATPGSAVAGRWIVVFRDDVVDAPGLANRLARQHGGTVSYAYQHAIKGFAAALPDAAVEALRRNPNVAYVEPDQVVSKVATQTNATWGLDRIDQPGLPLSTTYSYDYDGTGVRAYVLDTGIHLAHVEFTGRVSSGFDYVDNDANANDCDGHGTHVAGTVGGTTWGVAKNVQLVAVRVLDCNGNGTTSGVIAGIDWVRQNHVKPAVANMSLGGGASSALDQAVQNAIDAGVFFAVSAGNGDRRGRPLDACNQSPARLPAAMTVGATDQSDNEGSFSNYGTCVDILAPGVSIRSSYNNSNTGSATASGTSMASPHVAGAAALYLDANSNATPAQITSALTGNAVTGAIDLHSSSAGGGTPNRLLNVEFLLSGTEPPPPPPTGFTLSVRTYKVKGVQHADLTWSGSSATSIAVRRNGAQITTTANDGTYTDNIGSKGGGTYQYQVCEAGTSTCSNTVTASF